MLACVTVKLIFWNYYVILIVGMITPTLKIVVILGFCDYSFISYINYKGMGSQAFIVREAFLGCTKIVPANLANNIINISLEYVCF